MAISNVSVVISEGIGEEDYSLQWDLVDEDNNNPDCYLIGQSYIIRLYKSPDSLDPSVFNTNGSVNLTGSGITETTETVIFSGNQISNLPKPFIGGLSYQITGNVLDKYGSVFPNVTFSVSVGSSEIVASVPCFAVLEVTYTTKFYKYQFSGNSAGNLILIAIAQSNSEEAKDTHTIELYESCSDQELADCYDFDIEVDSRSEEGANYDSQNKKLIKVYNAERSDISSFIATKGTAKYLGTVQEEREEYLDVMQGRVNLEKSTYQIIEQRVTSGNLNPFILQEDSSVRMIDQPNDSKGGIPSGYGAIYIRYMTRFLKFLIEGEDTGKGVFLIYHVNNEEHCLPKSIEYELGENEGEKIYDITAIYRDFVTGAPLSEVKVWVDDSYIGETDDSGEILIKGISSNVKHLIRGSKPGYLKSDSDSIANDSFIVRDDT